MPRTLILSILIPPALWAVSNHIDKYLISSFSKTKSISTLIVYSGLIGLPAAIIIGLLNFQSLWFGLNDIILSMLAGSVYLCALIAYFRALENNEASRVAALFQLSPLISSILGYIFFKEILSIGQIVGGSLIVLGSIALSTEFDKFESKFLFNKNIFLLMFFSSFLLSIEGILFKYIAVDSSYWTTSFWMYVGYVIYTVLLLVLSNKIRKDFTKDLSRSTVGIVGINVFNEILSLIANLIFNFCLLLAPVGLVYLISEGLQPFFILLFGLLLTKFFPRFGKEDTKREHLIPKVLAIILIFIGLYFTVS